MATAVTAQVTEAAQCGDRDDQADELAAGEPDSGGVGGRDVDREFSLAGCDGEYGDDPIEGPT
jgi:hypothetical protein